jgi:hypothetical protein
MKNLSEQILRFKKLSGLINEDDKYGCVEGDCKNGNGKYSWEGAYYDGEFKNGRFHGKGIVYMNNKKYLDGRFVDSNFKFGKKFEFKGDEVAYFDEGEFINNELIGGGKRQYMGYGVENENPRNIHIEEGTFKNGVLEKGTIEYENGKKFTGTFEYVGDKVKFTSEDGLITTDDLDSYSISGKTPLNKKTTGFCVKGDCKNGEGEYLGPLGSYKGSFKNNLFNDLSGEATLDTNVNQNDFALENFDLTKNFHTHIFKYTGQFVNGEFDGEGTIEFSDGSIYEGDFNENKIEGIGTFTFKDGSIYQGKVETEEDGDSKSKYNLDYGYGSIDDVIDYNSKNTVEKLKLYDDGESVTDDDDDDDFYDYSDLDIVFSETDGNPQILNYVDEVKYPQIKGKNVEVSLEYVGDKNIKHKGKIDTGYLKFADVKHGNYILKADGKGLNKIERNITINKNNSKLTILLKNSNMKENFLVNKIKNLLIEGIDDIKVGDCFEYTGNVGETPNWYIKVTKIVDKENCLVDGIQEVKLDGQIEFSKNMEFRLSDLDQSIPENSRNWSLTTNENYLKIKKEYLDKVEKEGKKFVGTDYSNNSSLTIDVAKEDLPQVTNNKTEDKKPEVVTNQTLDGWKCIKGDCKNGASTMVKDEEDATITYEGEFTNGVFTKGKRTLVNKVEPLKNYSFEGTFIINDNSYDDKDYWPFNYKSGVHTSFEEYRDKTYSLVENFNDWTTKKRVGTVKVYDGNNLVFYFEGSLIYYLDEYVLGISSGKGKITFPNNKSYDGELIATEGKDDDILTFKNEKITITDVFNYNEKTNYKKKSVEKTKLKTDLKDCVSEIKNFYNFYVMVYRGQQTLPEDTGDLEEKRIFVEGCATSNYRNFNKETKEYIKRLMNVAPGTDQTIKFEDYFEINPVLTESKGIYSNNISNSIMKVLNEHSANKKVITTESSIIKNRLDFIYKTSNNYDLKFNLLKESKELIKKGYNENVVKTYYRRLIN